MQNNSAVLTKSKHPLSRTQETMKALKARADAKRSFFEQLADWINDKIGTIAFLILNLILVLIWVLINTGNLNGIPPFDYFPFGLLTLILSVEAILLTIFVLISQNRASRLFDLREEMDLQIDIITEQELTKMLKLQEKIANALKIDTSKDRELKQMERATNAEKLESELEKEI